MKLYRIFEYHYEALRWHSTGARRQAFSLLYGLGIGAMASIATIVILL